MLGGGSHCASVADALIELNENNDIGIVDNKPTEPLFDSIPVVGCIPNLLILLGDRYETAAIASAAVNARVPIAHLHGIETTESVADEAYRHGKTHQF